jgi:1-acyl-sn-glycerol-3-phosphate acyltransferase
MREATLDTLDRAIGGSDALHASTAVVAPVIRTEDPPRHPRSVDPEVAARGLPRGDVSALQRSIRHFMARVIANVVIKPWFKVELVGAERLPNGPAVYCFNHLSWLDPLALTAALPGKPRIYFYGPKEPNLRKGKRNRFMWWFGICVPFSPLKDDLLTSIRWVQAVFDTNGVLAIAGEGTIHVHEGDLLPFQEGPAYFALRGGVPLVPIAITGTSWARFRGKITIRIGDPIETGERPSRQNIAHYSARIWHNIRAMVAGDRDLIPPTSRIERRMTDMFNDWGPGGRDAASKLRGPDPADVPIPPAAAG